MHQAGALYVAEERGAFEHDERGGGTGAQTPSALSQISAAAPLARRPMIEALDAKSLVVVADFLHCSVKELEARYSR